MIFFLKKTGSWCLILVITFVLLEMVLRFVDSIPVHKNPITGFHRPDPTLGWIGRSDYKARFKARDFDVTVAYDSQGFRRATTDATKFPKAAKRIAFLGDSVTWGWGVENDETYPEQLQKMLGLGTVVYNFGVNAFGTAQQLLLFDRYVQQLNPDIVAIMFVPNDLSDNVDPKKGRRPWFELVEGKLVPQNQPVARKSVGWFKSLTQKSVAYSTLKYTFYIAYSKVERGGEEVIKKDEDPAVTEEKWRLFAALLAEFHQRCGIKNENCRLRVIYSPIMPEVRDYKTNKSSRWADKLKRICAAQGVDFLDLRPGLYDAWMNSDNKGPNAMPIYFEHDGHLDVEGNLATAKIIFNNWNL